MLKILLFYMKHCKQCNINYPETAIFCRECGGKLTEMVEKIEVEDKPEIKKHKKKKSYKKVKKFCRSKYFVLIVIVFVAIAILNIPISKPYQKQETYTENEPYSVTKNSQWTVSWRAIDDNGYVVEYLGTSTFQPTFTYDWGWGEIFGGRSDRISFEATTQINVPANKLVWFNIGSDDGSRLYVDDNLEIDNWGLHSYGSKAKNVYLNQGKHNLKLTYFEKWITAKVSFSGDSDIFTWQETEYRQVQKTRTVTGYYQAPLYNLLFG